jgi:F-type H+-transporting ATPase subunit a
LLLRVQGEHGAAGASEHGATVVEHATTAATESGKFNVGDEIAKHVLNSKHPIIELPHVKLPIIGEIDLSISKHVFMLWLVAAFLAIVVPWIVRRHIRQDRLIPTGLGNALEFVVEYVRDKIVEPNVGRKWVTTWAPFLLTMFFFILGANIVGLIPLFDVLGLINHYVLHGDEHSFLARLIHGGTTATGNFNMTAGLATITFFAIILAGSKAHGFGKHLKNIVPPGLHPAVYLLLWPIEVMGLFVKPFALTMRLAANITGGHNAILALLSFVFLFTEMFNHWLGIGVGVFVSIPLATGISGLEIIVVLVQAYVFTLLTAVFIGMAIHVHH